MKYLIKDVFSKMKNKINYNFLCKNKNSVELFEKNFINIINPKKILCFDAQSAEVLKSYYSDIEICNKFSNKEIYDLVYLSEKIMGNEHCDRLNMVIKNTKYILIKNIFVSDEIMLSSYYFIKKFRNSDYLEYATSFFEYGGYLLIKVNEDKINIFKNKSDLTYLDVQKNYDSIYYYEDCRGFDSFNKSLTNEMKVLYEIANISSADKVLDIGCGRGEFAKFIAEKTKAKVIGIDYSIDAIQIAKENLNNTLLNLEYINKDILYYNENEKFQKIIAADVIEHIDQVNLEKMFAKISRDLLATDGVFLVHTSPNKLYFTIKYKHKVELARQNEIYLPEDPRSIYENMMHINEQTEVGLNESLHKYFKYAYTWLADFNNNNIVGTLKNRTSTLNEITLMNIFAVASNDPIDIELLKRRLEYEI